MSNVLDECQDFFAAIFDSSDVIEFRTLKPVTKNWGAPASLPAMVDKLLALNAREAQCYFGANPRKQSGESTESGVALARCLFADFDGGVTAEVARSRIKAAGLPMPTATVATGGGVHCWWRLVEPLLDSKRWNALQKALAETLQSDAAGTSGWPRIMRLPGFVNHKYDHKPVAALVDVDPSRLYSLAELSPSKKGMSSASRAFVDRGEVAPRSVFWEQQQRRRKWREDREPQPGRGGGSEDRSARLSPRSSSSSKGDAGAPPDHHARPGHRAGPPCRWSASQAAVEAPRRARGREGLGPRPRGDDNGCDFFSFFAFTDDGGGGDDRRRRPLLGAAVPGGPQASSRGLQDRV